MLSILFSWIISSFVFIIFGKFLIQTFDFSEKKTGYNLADSFFLGLSTVGTIVAIVSLWFPLNGFVLLSLVAISIGYFIFDLVKNKSENPFSQIINDFCGLSKIYKAIIIFIALLLVCLTLLPPLIYDTGLYHLQAMMWTEGYPVIPGLGNIHGRFGFNSNSLLLYTTFSFKSIFGMRIFALQSLSLLVVFVWIVYKIIKIDSVIVKITMILISVMFLNTYLKFVASSSTDLLPNTIILYVFLRAILNKDAVKSSPLLFWIVPVFSLTLKLSVLPICLFSIIVMVNLIKEKQYKYLGFLMFGAVIILTSWFTRNIIITGYLIYPFPAIDIFNLDWKIPIALVADEKASITSWARMPGVDSYEVLNTPFYIWGKAWIDRHSQLYQANLAIVCFAAVSPIVVFYAFMRKIIDNKWAFYMWLIALSGTIFWAIMGPDERFAFAFIVITAFAPYMFIKINPKKLYWEKAPCVIFVIAFSIVSFLSAKLLYKNKGTRSYISFLYKPQTVDYIKNTGYQSLIEYKGYKLNSITIYKPTFLNQCFEQTLPCTPSYNNNLEMRGNSMKDGFRIKNN